MNTETTIQLDAEAVQAIRHALIVGLDSYGEVERLCEYAAAMESVGSPLPDSATPRHPTGSRETVGQFAAALARLNSL
jgi:hypothetical protein